MFPCSVASFAVGSDDVHWMAGRVTCRFFIIPTHSVCKFPNCIPPLPAFRFSPSELCGFWVVGWDGLLWNRRPQSWEQCFVMDVLSTMACALRSPSIFCEQNTLTRHFFSCREHALIVAYHTAWLKNVLLRVMSSA